MIKCQNNRCYSPLACSIFEYCRERNFTYGLPSKEQAEKWQKEDAAPTNAPYCGQER